MVSDNPESFADLDGHTCVVAGDCVGGQSGPGDSNGGSSTNPNNNPNNNTTVSACATTSSAAGCPNTSNSGTTAEQSEQTANQEAQQQNTQVGNTTSDALAKTMTNEVGSLSTPKKGNPDVLVDAKDALSNALINNANLDNPAKVAPATGTASTQDAQIMKDAVANRAKGGADPVEGRTQFGTTHNSHIQSRSAGNHLKGAAGRETVYEKFGPFRDSVSRRPTWIVIYNNPGQ